MIIQSSLLLSCGARGTTRYHLPPGGHHLLRPLPYLHPGGAGGTAGGGGVRDNTSASGAKSVSEEVFRELVPGSSPPTRFYPTIALPLLTYETGLNYLQYKPNG